MASMNRIMLMGTLGRDPEIKLLPSGDKVANISLATDESYKDKNTGQKVEVTEWHSITVFGGLCDVIEKYLKKGSRAYFEGKNKTEKYEKDGITRYSTKVIAKEMQMLDRAPSNNDMGSPGNQSTAQQPAQQPQRELGQSLTKRGVQNEMGYWYGDYHECHGVVIQRLRNAGIAMWACGATVPNDAWPVEGFR
jgi:single-strand DNA-binding protein